MKLAAEIGRQSPYVILLVAYLLAAAVARHWRAKPSAGESVFRAIGKDTAHAVAALVSIAVVHWVMVRTVGEGAVLLGVPVKTVFEFGHLAVILDWVIRCLARMLHS